MIAEVSSKNVSKIKESCVVYVTICIIADPLNQLFLSRTALRKAEVSYLQKCHLKTVIENRWRTAEIQCTSRYTLKGAVRL